MRWLFLLGPEFGSGMLHGNKNSLGEERMFERRLPEGFTDGLRGHELWTERLREDCERGEVFATVRRDCMDFYYAGGRLFHYDGREFSTHIKYASVIDASDEDANYLTAEQLRDRVLISDFVSGYESIKEKCGLYARTEAAGVADVYKINGYMARHTPEVILLDVEIAFGSRKTQRIDFLLMNTRTRTLRFVEAKHFSNREIWSTGTPAVVGQIARYERAISRERNAILSAYGAHVEYINALFPAARLPPPQDLDGRVTLYVFGFDNDQKHGRLKQLIIDNPEYGGVNVYAAQSVKGGLKGMWSKG
jgi:hypothetical protein